MSGIVEHIRIVARMTSLIQNLRYRTEVDGLRAIAVMAVLFFHAKLGFPGGFIGVDVFFVISGFLITSLIVKDLQEGSFTLFQFWERRARRIIPALVVVALTTLLAGGFLLLPLHYADLGKSGLYLSAFIANVYFYLGTGYFAGPSEEKPLLHTWSLAVEEQYYLVIPLLLLGLFRIPALHRRRLLLLILGAGLLASLWISTSWVVKHPAASFFLLPSRGWELLVGSIVALLPGSATPTNRVVREFSSYLGLAGILIPCFAYQKYTPFPGLAALPPCLGTALIIWSNGTGDALAKLTTLGRLLSLRAVVFIGLISYSLYLWHWPLVAFTNYWSLGPAPLAWRWCIVFTSLLLAVISWKFVETPFRKRMICPTRTQVFAVSVAGLVVVLGIGAMISFQQGLPGRLPDSLRHAFAENPKDDLLFVRNLEAEDVRAGALVPFGSRESGKPVDMLVWGDSHAMAALPAFDLLCKEAGIRGQAAICSARGPLVGWHKEDEKSRRFSEAVLDHVSKNKIPRVVLVAAWHAYAPVPMNSPAEGEIQNTAEIGQLQDALEKTIGELRKKGAQPYILLMAPGAPRDVPKAMVMVTLLKLDESQFTSRLGRWNGLVGYGTVFLKHIELLGARIIDPRLEFLDPAEGWYRISADGVSLYRDSHHLSKAGAEKMLVPALRRALRNPNELPSGVISR